MRKFTFILAVVSVAILAACGGEAEETADMAEEPVAVTEETDADVEESTATTLKILEYVEESQPEELQRTLAGYTLGDPQPEEATIGEIDRVARFEVTVEGMTHAIVSIDGTVGRIVVSGTIPEDEGPADMEIIKNVLGDPVSQFGDSITFSDDETLLTINTTPETYSITLEDIEMADEIDMLLE